MAVEFVANTYHTNHSNPLRFFLSHIKRQKWLIFGLFGGAFLNAGLAGVAPYIIGMTVDAVTAREPDVMDTVLWMSGAVVVSQLIRAVVQSIRNLSAMTFAERVERDIRDELYGNLLGKSMSFHDSMPVGEIMARVTNDVREINLMIYPGINLLVGSGMFLIMPVIYAPLIHPSLVGFPIVFVVVHVIIQYRFIRWMHPVAQRVRASFGLLNARLAESLDGLEVVKGAAQEDSEVVAVERLADDVRDHFITQGQIEARYLSYLLLGIISVLSFLHSAILFQSGVIRVGDIIAYNGLIMLFGFPVFTSLNSLSRIALGMAGVGRILSVINMKTDLDRNLEGHQSTMRGQIRFEDVSFGYNGNDSGQVLENITFEIEPGQTIAIVGQTGAGKSTITRLINRIYDVSQGRVLIDGVDVRDWDLASLRSQISQIEQDIFLFSRTIAENIAFGQREASLETIIDAAKKAQAHDFIMSFPAGYDTVIGQRGVTLSGGQRQRLAIARAFLIDPPVLILDDSTSAIDSATEDRIQQAIWAAAKGRTTILITHRLSQIRWADHIVVIRKGRVVAQGKHEELLETSEAYQRIFARYETQRPRTA